jgi:5,10-methylenetetrahydromethanopterin reductase
MGRVKAAVARGDAEGAARAISDETLRRFAFAGTPEDIVRQVTDLANAGATRVELGTPHGLDEASAIRLLGARVLPALR